MGNGVFFQRSSSSSEDTTARKKFSLSGFYKIAKNGDAGGWMGFWTSAVDSNNYTSLKRNSDGFIIFENKLSGTGKTFTTTSKFKDHEAWYHIVAIYDSTDSTAADRFKLFINGDRAAGAFSSDISADELQQWGNSSATQRLGMYNNNSGNSYGFTGYMTHVSCTVGYALAATNFGQVDTTGMWKARSGPNSVTFSGNGFFLKFENNGNLGVDSSGQSNNFSLQGTGGSNGSAVQTTDTPENNWPVMRIAQPPRNGNLTFAEGELSTSWGSAPGTSGRNASNTPICSIPVRKGKWYAEAKITANANGSFTGVTNFPLIREQDDEIESYAMIYGSGQLYYREYDGQSEASSNHLPSMSNDDIVMIALDMDNNNVYFGKNGQWSDGSGNANQANPTSARSLGSAFRYYRSNGHICFVGAPGGSSFQPTHTWNYGNPQFSISSAQADANGYGKFEYSVPSGYYALCTKNLALYGG